jgi:hypothetical protein
LEREFPQHARERGSAVALDHRGGMRLHLSVPDADDETVGGKQCSRFIGSV